MATQDIQGLPNASILFDRPKQDFEVGIIKHRVETDYDTMLTDQVKPGDILAATFLMGSKAPEYARVACSSPQDALNGLLDVLAEGIYLKIWRKSAPWWRDRSKGSCIIVQAAHGCFNGTSLSSLKDEDWAG